MAPLHPFHKRSYPTVTPLRGGLGCLALVASLASCGPAGDEVQSHPGAEEVLSQSSALAGQSVTCYQGFATPPGFPQQTDCIGTKFGLVVCKCYPADTKTTDLLPVKLVTIAYPPPGNMSSVTYSAGSKIGSIEQITDTLQGGNVIEVEAGGVDVEAKWTSGQVQGSQHMIQTVNTDTVGLVQSQNPLDHSFDVFYLWLNPAMDGRKSGITGEVSATMYPSNFMWSPTGQQVSSLGPNGAPRMQIISITANALANPAARTPAETGYLAHLTSAQISELLSLDDFFSNPAFDPATDTNGYRYVETLQLDGPEPGSPIGVNTGDMIEYDSENDSIDGHVSHKEATVKIGGDFSLGTNFKA